MRNLCPIHLRALYCPVSALCRFNALSPRNCDGSMIASTHKVRPVIFMTMIINMLLSAAASPGDRDPAYRTCVQRCTGVTGCARSPGVVNSAVHGACPLPVCTGEKDLILQLFRWDCSVCRWTKLPVSCTDWVRLVNTDWCRQTAATTACKLLKARGSFKDSAHENITVNGLSLECLACKSFFRC